MHFYSVPLPLSVCACKYLFVMYFLHSIFRSIYLDPIDLSLWLAYGLKKWFDTSSFNSKCIKQSRKWSQAKKIWRNYFNMMKNRRFLINPPYITPRLLKGERWTTTTTTKTTKKNCTRKICLLQFSVCVASFCCKSARRWYGDENDTPNNE